VQPSRGGAGIVAARTGVQGELPGHA